MQSVNTPRRESLQNSQITGNTGRRCKNNSGSNQQRVSPNEKISGISTQPSCTLPENGQTQISVNWSAAMALPALTPAVGGQCIADSALSPADVIVSTTNAAISRGIRSVTSSVVSHAMIYAGGGYVIEAIGDGVVKRPLGAAVADASLAVAFRHNRMTLTASRAVVSFAENQVGKGYDHTGILGQAGYQLDRWFLCTVASVRNCEDRAARANLWMSNNGRFFCSELVAEAYRKAGVPLVRGGSDSVSPERIVKVTTTGALIYVGHIVS
jgi:cell wall-associated NlpC family hydrolase